MTGETPIAVLHELGATFHQTNPVKQAGYTTVEQVTELVAGHRNRPGNSTLSELPKISQRRIDILCTAVDAWHASNSDGSES